MHLCSSSSEEIDLFAAPVVGKRVADSLKVLLFLLFVVVHVARSGNLDLPDRKTSKLFVRDLCQATTK